MTKKLFVLAICSLFIFGLVGIVMAEQSATSYSGKKYYEQQVFVDAYNNTGGTLAQNSVVVIDTTGTAADSLGAYFTTSSTAKDVTLFGVLDTGNLISGTSATVVYGLDKASVGRVCVRGPHQVLVSGTATTGLLIGQSGTLGYGYVLPASTNTSEGVLGYSLATNGLNTAVWAWINPHPTK